MNKQPFIMLCYSEKQ